jgi:hypothetical protein
MAGLGPGYNTLYSKIVHVNSNDRIPGLGGNRSTNFVMSLGTNLQKCKQISYKSSVFNNNIYNVREVTTYNPTFNNRWTFQAGGNPLVIIAQPQGFYNVNSLMTYMIQTIEAYVLANYGDTWVLTYTQDPNSQLVQLQFVSAAGPDSTLFVMDNLLAAAGQANTGYGPWQMLGLPANFQIPHGTNLTSLNMPSMNAFPYVYLRSQALAPSNAFLTSGQIVNDFQAIPVTAPFMGRNTDDCKVDVLCNINYTTPRLLNQIDIQLVDHDGWEINLMGGTLAFELRAKYDTN